MNRLFLAPLLALSLGAAGCDKQGSPEQVADAFVDAYFRQVDQEKAKEFAALGAAAMLETELHDVEQVRKEGYTPVDAAAEITFRRGESTSRDQRVRYAYEISVKVDDAEMIRDADIELTQIDGAWKVVRVGLTQR